MEGGALSYLGPMGQTVHAGVLLREWRQRRRFSQLDLACEAGISTRHLSFIESGRSQPSRDMIVRLAERLEVPLRERNALLTAGGFAHLYSERTQIPLGFDIGDNVIQIVLRGHEPYPALAIDRHWNLVASNSAVRPLLAGVDSELLKPPANVLRLSLHPSGLAPRIRNLAQWRSHLLTRLTKQIDLTADADLVDLRNELSSYPFAEGAPSYGHEYGNVAVPLELSTDKGTVALISTTMVFGTPLDVTLSELAIESFFPADDNSAAILRAL